MIYDARLSEDIDLPAAKPPKDSSRAPFKEGPYVQDFVRMVGNDKHVLWVEHKGDGDVKALLLINGRLAPEGSIEHMGEDDLAVKIAKEGWTEERFDLRKHHQGRD